MRQPMSQPPSADASEPTRASSQTAGEDERAAPAGSVAENSVTGNQNRVVQGDDNQSIQGDCNQNIYQVKGNRNWLGNTLNVFLGQQPATTATQSSRPRTEQLLLQAVKEEVTLRLDSSLHNAVLLNLEKELHPHQVKRLWEATIKIGSKPSAPLPAGSSILDVFDRPDIQGKLLILGAPGSGKTTTQLELAQSLIARAENDSSYPLPVLFNLASWKDDQPSLSHWLVAELNSKYGLRSDIGQRWIENRQLLPLLDGLDELEPNRQEPCIRAINQLLNSDNRPSSLVVCSRSEEYENLIEAAQTRLQLNGAICLQPLTEKQIQDYIKAVDRTQQWCNISSDLAFLELSKTPLFLSLTILVYETLPVEKLQQLIFNENRLQALLDEYIWQMLARNLERKEYTKGETYNARQIRTWLVWLARYLEREAQTEFLIEKIQPTCLRSRFQNWAYQIGIKLILGLILSFVFIAPSAIQFAIIASILVWLLGSFLSGIGTRLMIEILCSLIVAGIFYISIQVAVLDKSLTGYLITIFIIIFILSILLSILPTMKIEPVETLKLGLRNGKKELSLSVLGGSTISLMMIFFFGLNGLIPGAILGLCGSLLFMLGFGLTGRLIGPDMIAKYLPNQGIQRSAINAIFSTVFLGVAIGVVLVGFLSPGIFLTIACPSNITVQECNQSVAVATVKFSGWLIVSGLAAGFIGGLFYGGVACVQHLTLRLVLFFSGCMPWNYARFLDYCTERLLLQRVGGRYRFVHKLLQEHFAAMPLERR